MAQPTEILVEEHNLIRRVLEHLTLAKEKLETGERPPVGFFEKALAFVRTFVQKFHHFKEEYLMFERLAEKKDGAIDAQVESLRYQHERGRDHIAEISKALKGYRKGEEIQTLFLIEHLAAYVTLLRHHIHREEHVFYPMVEELLSVQEKKELLKTFKQEEKKLGPAKIKEIRALVREMGLLL